MNVTVIKIQLRANKDDYRLQVCNSAFNNRISTPQRQTLKKTTELLKIQKLEAGKMSQKIILISKGFPFWLTLVWRLSVLKNKLEFKSQLPVSALNSRIIQFPYGKLFFVFLVKRRFNRLI